MRNSIDFGWGWLHWQNLKHEGERPSVPGIHARAFLSIYKKNRGTKFHVEWCLGRQADLCLAQMYVGGCENDLSFSFGIPFLFYLAFGVDALLPYKALPRDWHRTTGIAIHNWAIWVDIWNDDSWGGKHKPKWQDFCIHVDRLLFGPQRYGTRDMSTERIYVLMPERPYPATVRLFESTWSWPRLRRSRRMIRAEITPDQPITHPGKGENSWDCGEDATFSMTCPAATAQEAAAILARNILSERA